MQPAPASGPELPAAVGATYARAERHGFMLSCEPAVGRLLATLAASVPAGGRILEMGTGIGVGTSWIVHGVGARDDVQVVTVDLDEQASAIAREASWPAWVTLRVGDVLAVLDELGRFDLIFADAQGGKWTGLDRTIAALRPGGLLLVDDMTPPRWMDDAHERHTARVRATLLSHPDLVSSELACGSGMILCARRRAPR
ncbi:class I SAM-dependent methyltransferase [Candidatus Binatia bacterium]|jgi:predicted O-methyltransferase YrrM|nr:class I SAM-dependent methyltransferase [Candidatus Binatia bacterium]